MPRTFAYLRVSTTGQTTDNQLQEIKAAGFKVEPRRVITETISGNDRARTSRLRGPSNPPPDRAAKPFAP
jgi:DNA invertase Pin-like site-specific DNA recombinase